MSKYLGTFLLTNYDRPKEGQQIIARVSLRLQAEQ